MPFAIKHNKRIKVQGRSIFLNDSKFRKLNEKKEEEDERRYEGREEEESSQFH